MRLRFRLELISIYSMPKCQHDKRQSYASKCVKYFDTVTSKYNNESLFLIKELQSLLNILKKKKKILFISHNCDFNFLFQEHI